MAICILFAYFSKQRIIASFFGKKSLFLSALFLLIGFNSTAQFYNQSQADILKLSLEGQKEKERVQTLIHLSDCYYQIQLDSSLLYANIAKKEAEEIGYDWGVYKSLYQIAKVEYQSANLKELEKKLKKITRWFIENSFQKDAVYTDLIYNYCISKTAPFKQTKEHLDSLFLIAEQLNDGRLLANIWYHRHMIQASQLTGSKFQASLDSAEKYYKKVNDSLGMFHIDLRRLKYDGYKSKITLALKDIEKVKAWNSNKALISIQMHLGLSYAAFKQFDSSQYFNQQALSYISTYGGSKSLLSQLYFRIGYIHHRRHVEYNKAIEWFIKAKQVDSTLGNHFKHYSSASYLGDTYKNLKKYQQAIKYYLEALKIAKLLKHNYYINSSRVSLGRLYHITDEFEKAENHYHQALVVAKESFTGRSRYKKVANIEIYMGKLYRSMGEYGKAISELTKAFEWCIKGDQHNALIAAIIKMSVYIDMKDYKNARNTQKLITDLYETRFKEKKFYFNTQFAFQIARIEFTQGNYEASIGALNKFIENSSIAYSPDKELANELLYRAHSKLGQYKKALQYFEAFKTISDSLKNNKEVENIALIQSKYELSEKEADLIRMKQEKEIQQLSLEKQKTQIGQQKKNQFLILLIAISVLALILLFFNRYRLRRENKDLILQARQAELEREQEQTNRQLAIAQLRSDFFTNVSHEFRTPLTLILGPLEKLLSKEKLEYQKDIERIHRNAQHLLSLINETLDLSKIESGHLPLTTSPVVLGGSVAKIIQSFVPLAEKQQIDLKLIDHSNDCLVEVDENKLYKILVNFLGNAFKHTPSGGVIQTIIDRPDSDTITIHVRDNGRGIEKKHLPHIFDRFYQGDSKTKGTGVGLAFSKQLIELHGGTIIVESEVGRGSTFSVQLPLQQKKLAGKLELEKEAVKIINSELPIDGPFNTQNKTVLIIEDNEDVRDYVKEILKPYYQLSLAADGQEGIELAEQNSPDLIVSDVMMPHKDGFQLTQYLKQNMATSHIPIILLTAKASVDSKLKGLELGADDYLGKPFNEKELLQRCKNLIQQREQLQKLFVQSPMHRVTAANCTSLDQNFMDKALEIVKANYKDETFTVEQFCEQLALNRSSVHYKIKGLTGQSASQYIQTFRLAKAGDLLIGTNQTISAIIIDTGFNSGQAFYKAFRKYFEMTPSEYRKQNK